jgi:hypothetical protein
MDLLPMDYVILCLHFLDMSGAPGPGLHGALGAVAPLSQDLEIWTAYARMCGLSAGTYRRLFRCARDY